MTLNQFFYVVEMRTKIVSLSTFFIAFCYSLYIRATIDPVLFSLTLAAALAVDMGTTGFNNLFDYLKGNDAKALNHEKEKVMVHEGVDPTQVLVTSTVLYIIAVVLGLVIAYRTDWKIALAGAVCMAVGFFYTAGPYPVSRTALGEVFAGGFLGTFFFLIVVYVFTGTVTLKGFLISLPSFFMIASILAANNTCDIEGDTRAGRKTLSILLGREKGEALVYMFGVLAILVMSFFYLYGIFPGTFRFPLGAGIIVTFFLYRKMNSTGYSHETKDPIMGLVSLVFAVYSCVMITGFVLAVFL